MQRLSTVWGHAVCAWWQCVRNALSAPRKALQHAQRRGSAPGLRCVCHIRRNQPWRTHLRCARLRAATGWRPPWAGTATSARPPRTGPGSPGGRGARGAGMGHGRGAGGRGAGQGAQGAHVHEGQGGARAAWHRRPSPVLRGPACPLCPRLPRLFLQYVITEGPSSIPAPTLCDTGWSTRSSSVRPRYCMSMRSRWVRWGSDCARGQGGAQGARGWWQAACVCACMRAWGLRVCVRACVRRSHAHAGAHLGGGHALVVAQARVGLRDGQPRVLHRVKQLCAARGARARARLLSTAADRRAHGGARRLPPERGPLCCAGAPHSARAAPPQCAPG